MDTYEKKYNEALERAKQIRYGNPSSGTAIVVCEQIFPELAESEDEMIWRTLVEYFGPEVQLDFVRGVPIQKIRDWLEKQKEQKPAEWSEDDDWKRKELIQYLEEKGDYRTAWMTWLKSLRPQPHWKPSEEQMRGLKYFLDYHRSQRNAGTTNWREYDAVESLYEQLRKL